MGSRRPSTTRTTTVTTPWTHQQPYLKTLFREAQRLYDTEIPEPFPGSTYVTPSAQTTEARQLFEQIARGELQTLSSEVITQFRFLLKDAISVGSNPHLTAHIQQLIDTIEGDTDREMQKLDGNVLASGLWGSSRQGVLQSYVIRDRTRQIKDAVQKLLYDNYENRMDLVYKMVTNYPAAARVVLAPVDLIQAVGFHRDEFSQLVLKDRISKWNFNQNRQWDAIGRYATLVSGNYGGTSTGTTEAQESSSPLNTVLGAAMFAGGVISGQPQLALGGASSLLNG